MLQPPAKGGQSLVWVAGFEPATFRSRTGRAPNCATPIKGETVPRVHGRVGRKESIGGTLHSRSVLSRLVRVPCSMGASEDIGPLVPLALGALAELLDTQVEKLPAGIAGVLEHYGIACHKEGWDRAHDEPTMPGTEPNPLFSPVRSPSGTFRKNEGGSQR